MTMIAAVAKLDHRRHAIRADLAAERLRGHVDAPRFVTGTPAQVVRASVALRAAPGSESGVDTEALYGETVSVYDTAAGWSWVQLDRDGYVGYVETGALTDIVVAPTHKISALGTYVYREPDIKSQPLMHLSLNAAVCIQRVHERLAELRFGGFVVQRHLVEIDRHARDFVEIAERFVGTPYLWGGRTRLGLDCSGLVQIAMEAAGIPAPRDSDMQANEIGVPLPLALPVPGDIDGLRRGDLVCWPGHIGIMVDSMMLVHANAHHMAVAVEPLQEAAARIARAGSTITAVRRPPHIGA